MTSSSHFFRASLAFAFLVASSSAALSFWADRCDCEYRGAGWPLPHVELGTRLVLIGLFSAWGPADSQVAGPIWFSFQSIAGSVDSSLDGVCCPLFMSSRGQETLLRFVLPARCSLPLSFCCCCAVMSAWRPRGSRFQRPGRPRYTVSAPCCGRTGATGWPHTAGTALVGLGISAPPVLMARRIAGMLSGLLNVAAGSFILAAAKACRMLRSAWASVGLSPASWPTTDWVTCLETSETNCLMLNCSGFWSHLDGNGVT